MALWDVFIWFGISAVLLSAGGAGVSLMANDHWSLSSLRYRRLRTAAIGLASAALLVMIAFAVLLWISLGTRTIISLAVAVLQMCAKRFHSDML